MSRGTSFGRFSTVPYVEPRRESRRHPARAARAIRCPGVVRTCMGQSVWRVVVERPLHIEDADPNRVCEPAEFRALKEDGRRGEDAPRVIRKIHKPGVEADPSHGLFEAVVDGKTVVVGTSLTPTCATRSGSRSPKKAASRRFCSASCRPARLTPGTCRKRPSSAARSASPATSASCNPFAAWTGSRLTFLRWSGKAGGCRGRSSARRAGEHFKAALNTRVFPFHVQGGVKCAAVFPLRPGSRMKKTRDG